MKSKTTTIRGRKPLTACDKKISFREKLVRARGQLQAKADKLTKALKKAMKPHERTT